MTCLTCGIEIPLSLIPDVNGVIVCPACGKSRRIVWMSWKQWVWFCLSRPLPVELAALAKKPVFGRRSV